MDSSKSKVILILIPNLNFGGAQRVFYNLSLELSKHYQVVECVFNFDAGHAFHSGNKVVSLDVRGGKTLLGKLWQFYLRCKKLREIKKSLNPAVCISHLEGADLINVLTKINEKTITWVHGSKYYDQNISGILGFLRHKLLIPFTYKNADKVITVSKAIKQELIQFYSVKSENIEQIYNYFDVDEIVGKSQSVVPQQHASIFENGPSLIFVGRLVKQKNPLEMLRWFATFIKQHPCKLIIVGDGEMREEMIALCKKLELNMYSTWSEKPLNSMYNVYFLGFQDNPFQYIKMATAFILTSSWEGFPMVLGEAMACGAPIIASDCPTGPKEMLLRDDSLVIKFPYSSAYGVLLPLLNKNTYSVWTQGVSSLLKDEGKLIDCSNQSIARAGDFSKEKNSQYIVELVESVLK